MTDGTIVFSVPEEDLDATGRVILEAGRWCKIFYADGPWRPRGRWYIENNSLVVLDVCDQCMRSVRHVAPFYDFCPHCGADMRGGKQDERSD